ncbi:MAG: MOSC domain-containing protein [Gemmatimonadetes bacterium]|nr:MOSC domain-containing protein [Gemmatimonadota bacterium]
MSGRIEALWSKRAHRGPMDPRADATLVPNKGMAGSVGRSTRRQVTILSREAWETATTELGAAVDPSMRRANILVSGLDLHDTRGRTLRIGSCRLIIGGELTPCERMEEASPGLQAALTPRWRGGVFAQVEEGGEVRVGDVVQWEPGDLSSRA